MLGHQPIARHKDQRGTVKCSLIAFDHPDHDVQVEVARPGSDLFGLRPGADHGRIPVAAEEVAACITAAAHLGAEIHALGISPEQRLGKHHQADARSRRLPARLLHLAQGCWNIEQDRSQLRRRHLDSR